MEALNDALLQLAIERVQGRVSVGIWLAAWGVEPHHFEAFDVAAQGLLTRLFPQERRGAG